MCVCACVCVNVGVWATDVIENKESNADGRILSVGISVGVFFSLLYNTPFSRFPAIFSKGSF